jgi:hypothetical protein
MVVLHQRWADIAFEAAGYSILLAVNLLHSTN